jgi:4-hydroxy-3-methylbut-2-enyl diphosphate reductase
MPIKRVVLAKPRGFCAGVDRAIDVVNMALQLYGSPVYVRKEIVHNKYVIRSLAAKGAVFIDELDEVPDGAVRFSVPTGAPPRAAPRPLPRT